MNRDRIALATVPPAHERRALIEAEPLPINFEALIREASREGGDSLVWHFIDSGEKLRYDELETQTRALAAGFVQLGIRKGTHVAVMLPNIAAMPLTWLALGILGAVMVPLNTGYSEREIEYVLNDSSASFVVTTSLLLPTIQRAIARGAVSMPAERMIVAGSAPAGHVALGSLMQADPGALLPTPDVHHDTLLNIQYTSGTTGFPKGCMLSQRFWLSSGKVNAFRDGRGYRRILASTPFYYMDPQWLLLMALYQKATLYVAERQSASRFMEWVRTYEIEFCLLPYLTLKQPADARDSENAVVRANVYGVPPALHARLEERFDICAREAFGMTEVGPTLYMPIEAIDMVGSGSCGIPCPFRECRVADESGATAPLGTVGELLVRGPGIMLGYYNRPDATNEAFHGDWFRTGDLFRMDERGYFYIVGRIKDTIRRSGENIAAREVEAVLASHPDIAEVAVIPVKDEIRGEEIKAIVVWRVGAGTEFQVASLIEHCHRNLAPFKVPRFFESRLSLPKTGSSKIAKHVLLTDAPGAIVFDRIAVASAAPRVGGEA
ncbi:AMP-binding protein [Bradyrhizobium sp. B097]|uniref:class I adenylate-forming enzyme family protein n=1 Tax=Bradyrhizobium sp. B097 TaxID=3140244 RepID=UPI003182C531